MLALTKTQGCNFLLVQICEILLHLPQHFFMFYLPCYTWFVPAMAYGIVQTINSVGKVWSL